MKFADMIPGENMIGRKASEAINKQDASVKRANGVGVSGGSSETPKESIRRRNPLKNLLSSTEHLDWLKIDLNAAKIITVQNNKCT